MEIESQKSEIIDNKVIEFLTKPYFYTLQDHLPTRQKQLSLWANLTYKFFAKQNITEFSRSRMESDDFILYNNTRLNRRLDKQFVDQILETLARSHKVDFKDANKETFHVYKISIEDLADAVYKWAKMTAKIGKTATLQELSNHDDTKDQIFWGIPEEVLLKACRELESRNKIDIIDLGGEGNVNDMGVKFK